MERSPTRTLSHQGSGRSGVSYCWTVACFTSRIQAAWLTCLLAAGLVPFIRMKRLTPRFKHWLVRRAQKRRRRQSRWIYATVATREGTVVQHVRPSRMPERLCLDDAYDETIGFVAGMRTRWSRPPSLAVRQQMNRHWGRIGWIRDYQDFTSLHEITPGAALLLAAEYDRIRQLSGPLRVVDLEKWDEGVYDMLGALGFFDLLDLPPVRPVHLAPGFHIQPLTSGIAANSRPAIDQIVDLFQKAGGDEALRLALCGAVVDALENVKDHAYPHDFLQTGRHIPNWWFTGAANQQKNWLILGIYDQGVSIPVTLPRRFGLNQVAALFTSVFGLPFDPADPRYDGQCLDAAMRLSETSTGEPHRGKGLHKIKEVVGRTRARLRIVSRFGEYVYSRGQARSQTHNVALPGTYIEIVAFFE